MREVEFAAQTHGLQHLGREHFSETIRTAKECGCGRCGDADAGVETLDGAVTLPDVVADPFDGRSGERSAADIEPVLLPGLYVGVTAGVGDRMPSTDVASTSRVSVRASPTVK